MSADARRKTNPMVVLSAVLDAAGAGSRVSVDGRRVLLTQADGQVLAFEARCSEDAEWIADTAALDRAVVRDAAVICAASVYGFAKPVFTVALRAWPARMIEGLPIGWARGKWGCRANGLKRQQQGGTHEQQRSGIQGPQAGALDSAAHRHR